MVQDRTREQVRRYDLFKLVVAIALVVIIVILLLTRGEAQVATAPTIDRPAAGTKVTVGEIELAGTGDAGDTVEVLLDDQPWGSTVVGSDGQWSLTAPVTVPGDHELVARIVDKNGGELASSEAIRLTVAEFIVEPPAGLELATLTIDAPVGDMTTGEIALSGTGAPASVVEILANGEVLDTITVGEDGTWSFPAQLDAGDHTLSVRAVGSDGKVLAESEPVTLEIPEPAVEPPTFDLPDEFPADGKVTVSGTAEPGSILEVVANGEVVSTVTVGEDGTWSWTKEFDPGDFKLIVRAVDAGGQVLAESEPVTFQIPEVVAIEPPTFELPDELPAGGDVALSGTAASGSILEIVANGEVVGTATVGEDGTWSIPIQLNPGDYRLIVRTVDAEGKVLAESEGVTFEVQAPVAITPPTLVLPDTEPAGGEWTLSGTGLPGSTIEIVANGEVLVTITVGDDGTWSWMTVLDAGDYNFSVRAVDADGQVLAESEPVTLQVPEQVATGPVLEWPTGEVELISGRIELRGSGAPGTEIEILDNGEVIGTAAVSDEGAWTFSHKFAAGEHELAVQNAGAPDSRSEARTVSLAETGICVGEPPHGIDKGDTYVVARCEYMGLIAERTGVSLKDLIAANPQVENPSLIYPGQILNLPPRD